MRKELPNQESLFDSIPASDRLYGVGDRLYRLVLDSVRPIVVTERSSAGTADDPARREDVPVPLEPRGRGGNWTFGKGDVGVNVFESRADAEAQGVRNIREMGVDVVPAASIAPSEWLALEENGASFGRARPLYACCGLVGGTFVFRKGWHAYCFLDAYPTRRRRAGLTGRPSPRFAASGGCRFRRPGSARRTCTAGETAVGRLPITPTTTGSGVWAFRAGPRGGRGRPALQVPP